ncbi:MAG: SDR family NAD(P)-dependent oxidoreductase [Planctomycetota bacterium]|jgi:3-oxoacyl-[acyl-carrier protein] reductase
MIYEDLKDKKVLVTGSSSGIGAAAAVMFAQQGAFVGVHYFKSKDGAEDTLGKVKQYSDGVMLKADVRDEKQVTDMIDQFAKAAGGIDVLVNNAGDMIKRVPFETASVEYHDDIYATNVRSILLTSKAVLDYLKKSKGNIINIGSVGGHTGGGNGSEIYCSSKGAVATETICMARAFAQYGIRVNSVMPGFIETRFHARHSDPAFIKSFADRTPLGRNGTAEDVATAILFLASNEAAGFITGEYIAVNGGLYMRA